MSQKKAVLSAAWAYAKAGYSEIGNNDTIFGRWFGLNNQPWCAMFVSKCFDEGGAIDLIKGAQTKKGFASCDAGLKFFAKRGQLVPVGQAQEGDIVFFQFDADAQPDHVGICFKNDGKNLYCLEGNTSGDGKGSQSNGDGVYKKKRPYKLVMAVVRPKWAD